MNDGPAASLIVPTRNRANLVSRFLPSLAEQEVGAPYEVIIADNYSTDSTPALVEEAAARWPHVRLIREPQQGGALARHAGAQVARSPLLIFIDDDMKAAPNLVAEHLRAHSASPGGVVLGNILSAPGPHPFDRMMAYVYDGPKKTLAGRVPTPFDFWSGNISMARDLYFQLGGYSPALAALRCGEDLEFGSRVCAAGVKMRFAPDAITYHHFTERFGARLNRSYRIGVVCAYLKERHPELQVDVARPPRDHWRLRATELACRAAARLIEPFDRGEGMPVKPLAFIYDLGLRTATERGMAEYRDGRAPLKRSPSSAETPPAGRSAEGGLTRRQL